MLTTKTAVSFKRGFNCYIPPHELVLNSSDRLKTLLNISDTLDVSVSYFTHHRSIAQDLKMAKFVITLVCNVFFRRHLCRRPRFRHDNPLVIDHCLRCDINEINAYSMCVTYVWYHNVNLILL